MSIAPVDRWGRPIDLALALDGGQVFTWWPVQDGSCGQAFAGLLEGRRVLLRVAPGLPPGCVAAEGPARAAAARAVAALLDLDRDYRPLDERLRRLDARLARVMEELPGLRIVRLSPWEALLSFLLATHASIARIKGMVAALVQALGPDGSWLPAPAAIAAAGEKALRSLGLGYRARYVHGAACRLAEDPHLLQRWADLETHLLRQRLMELPGVGRKVADCVLLFGYGRWDAFPIDRWVKRALETLYFGGERVPQGRLQAFVHQRFGELGGLAQAYLFARWRAARPHRGQSQGQVAGPVAAAPAGGGERRPCP
ncbi:MAG TPA: DNA glycosylase [Limnochordales bacterium]